MEDVAHDPLASRPLRIGVFVARENRIVVETILEPGIDVTLGADASATVVVPGWEGPTLRLVAHGRDLHLEPGMRLHMCGDGGEGRVVGTYEELTARGVGFPLRLSVSKLNIKVREGISVFGHYVPDGWSG